MPNWRENYVRYARSEDIDIASRAGASWLASIIDHAAPDILFVGPIYRMTSGIAKAGDIGGEDAAKRAAFALDKMRERFGCALVSETHAAKGDTSRSRDMRPFGSSVWTRWPEFGYALVRPDETSGLSKADRMWQNWRGDRDPREWPGHFSWHNDGWRMRAEFPDGVPSWYSALLQGQVSTSASPVAKAPVIERTVSVDDFLGDAF